MDKPRAQRLRNGSALARYAVVLGAGLWREQYGESPETARMDRTVTAKGAPQRVECSPPLGARKAQRARASL